MPPSDSVAWMQHFFSDLTPGPRNLITDVAGVEVGNAQDNGVRSGVTVVLANPAAVGAVETSGGAPGTRETDALRPECLVEKVDAVVLAGGSVYGLDAASGVTAWAGAKGRGISIPGAPLSAPIVPAAILFDLANGGDKSWGANPPYRALGVEACENAGVHFALGNAGAGLGATAGRYKGGLGSASITTAGGLVVGALVAVNAAGAPTMPGTECFWAAPFEIGGEFGGHGWPTDQGTLAEIARRDPLEFTKIGATAKPVNTTIAVIATNAVLNQSDARRVAIMAHDGLARALRPVHTPLDGDTVFVLATAKTPLPEPTPAALAVLGSLAADTLARAVARGVFEATTLGDHQSYREMHG
ncbi:MAG: P1 family peptidase [Alphaproteobacteria bacterium]